jgi:hypothetical protein
LSGLTKYHTESAIIGRLLTGYTDLEIDLLHCVQNATGDFDTACRAMFGVRGDPYAAVRSLAGVIASP